MRRTTLQDIADHLEVNISTVSRSLSNSPRIPVATRKRVQRVAAEMGYRPDSVLSALAASRWQRERVSADNVIAYISCVKPDSTAAELPSLARLQAADLGYKFEVFERSVFKNSAKLQATLRNRGIYEVIIGPVEEESLQLELDWDKFIAIQLLPGLYSLPLHSVIRDHFSAVVMIWRKVVSLGYCRIGCTLLDHSATFKQHSSSSWDDLLRISAVDSCQNHLFSHLPKIPPFHFSPGSHRRTEFMEWCRLHNVDAVIDFNETHSGICRTGFNSPLPYACLNKGRTDNTLSGVLGPMEIYAREAINLLHYCGRTHQWGIPKQRIDHVVEPVWFEGDSLPAKAAA